LNACGGCSSEEHTTHALSDPLNDRCARRS
jgi:hypothetical protein